MVGRLNIFALDCGPLSLQHTKKEKRRFFLFGCLLGLAAFLLVYGVAPLDVTNDSWVLRGYVEVDITMEYSVWNAYRNAPWSWPIGYVQSVDYPVGSSVALLSPPAFLMPILKLLNPILPETFQFYGWWALACSVLQGGAAALLISLFPKSWATIGLGSVLFIFCPAFLERSFRHASLSGHFVLLLGLYYYFSAKREKNTKYLWLKYLGLATLGIGMSAYYYAVLIALLAVLLLDLRKDVQTRKKWMKWAKFVAIGALCVAVPMAYGYALGMFVSPESLREPFGYYSMNVNQIYNPVSYQGKEPLSADQTLLWSRILPQQPLRDGMYIRAGGQYDGFNYLGFGVLLALACVLVGLVIKNKKGIFRNTWLFIKRYLFLLLLAVFLVLYSWSNLVYWGESLFFHYSIPYRLLMLTSMFRASSRMFYLVGYLIFLVVVVTVPRLFNKRQVGAVALLLVVALQLFDISPALQWKRAYFETQTAPYTSLYAGTAIEYAAQHFDKMWINTNKLSDYDLMVLVSKNGVLTNLQFGPRYLDEMEAFNEQEIARWLSGQLQPDEALLIYDDDALLAQIEQVYADAVYIVQVGELHLVVPAVSVASDSIALFA